jgi:GDP-L-fucose synthase
MNKNSTILITGGGGMVGSALIARLKKNKFNNLLTPTSKELDLTSQKKVFDYFSKNQIDYVFHLAAKVGGIAANIESPADFLYENIIMESNVIHAAYKNNIKKLVFLGSSCIYPKECKQPMKEDSLLTGKLEPTNEGYALAKIAGLKLCEYYNKQYKTNYIALMPCNLYGENDHFELKKSHVISALIYKFTKAKKENSPFVEIWGTGKAQREFLYIDDLVDALYFFMKKYDAKDLPNFVNIGSGVDISIKELAILIKKITKYSGDIHFDKSKPDGMLRKLLDTTEAEKLGWKHKTSIEAGLKKTIKWYLGQENK